MLLAGDGAHQQDVRLLLGVLGVVDPGGLLLELLAEALLGGELEAVGQHHHRPHVQAHEAAVTGQLLHGGVVGNLNHRLEHGVGEDRLGNFHPGGHLGQVAVGANDLAGGFPRRGVILLGPERVGPAGGSAGQHHGDAEQRAEQ